MLKRLVSYPHWILNRFPFLSFIEVLAIASSASTVPPPVSTMVLEQSNSATVKRKAKKKTSATMSTSLLDKQNFDRIDLKSALEGLHDRM